MADMEQAESELLVDPGFFTALPSRLPGRIEHVEILPKKMRATNELSCYRYAAVVHIKAQGRQRQRQQYIHDIGREEWIDFMGRGLDRQSLSQLLQRPSTSSVVAISNIPHSKTVFERSILGSLDNRADGAQSHSKWLASVRQNAEHCPSLSATDLVELAQQAGCRVEISWARQYSQRGGLDAVFHRRQPTNGESRVMFRFPADHQGRPHHSLSSQPLRQQTRKRLREELTEKLQAQLPSYMVPQVITMLDKMPVTDNGKIDRRALADRVETRTGGRGPVRQPTSEAERQMQKIWGQVLNVEPSTIGLDDSFFKLGGDSITAMKLVGEARKGGIQLSVADIFQRNTLAELAHQQNLNIVVQIDQESEGAALVDSVTKTALLEQVDSSVVGIHSGEIADILPLTNAQEKIVVDGITVGQSANYFYVDAGANVDLSLLNRGCALTLERFPILRACFLCLQGRFWQIVLHRLHQPLRVYDVCEDLDESFRNFCFRDLQELSPTQPPFAFVLLRHTVQGIRLILRMSHAQYDGICAPIIFQSLIDGGNKGAFSVTPSFSTFLSYASRRRPRSVAYWSELLQGSRLTTIRPKLHAPDNLQKAGPKPIRTQAEADLPRLPGNITAATFVSTAWAILLSRISGENDVVYGHVVAGRNSAIQGMEEIVGPCLNIVPVRVILSSSQTPVELMLSVQKQFLGTGEADSLGFKDIVEHCTDWPAGSSFDTTIQHQNVDEHPEIQTSEGRRQMHS
ncbi:hypothetical protein HIM_12079 [Hirsutella minnesotensis 3608]|uniref:Carrier domain-containing protein n=1 Tax=Hirsutella minnesotensis 3608 TaxID=1043627 RepID=A0A0F7ZF51_9HYPO|nr:hypothetical protein HIM_12079 [Hirsutella minnesotensis 3608]